MAYGVLATGFQKMRLSDIQTEIQNDLKAALGNGLNFLPKSTFSQVVGVFADREAALWELFEQVYLAGRRSSASDVQLDDLLALVNVARLPAQKSSATLILFGTEGTLVPAGTRVAVQGAPDSIFETSAPVTLGEPVDAQQLLYFSLVPDAGTWALQYVNETTGPLAFNASAADVASALNALANLDYVAVSGNTSMGFRIAFHGNSGGIDQPLLQVVQNGLTSSTAPVSTSVVQSDVGIPQAVVAALATETGPIVAPEFALTQIQTPVSGLDRVVNIAPAQVGRDLEGDNAFRQRADDAQRDSGKGSQEAIRTKLLAVTGVQQAIVFSNRTLSVDGNGLPPKSVRAYVQGGVDQDVLNQIWQVVGAGIQTDGQITGTVIDSQGVAQSVSFSRPVEKRLYMHVRITKTAAFPTNGTILVQTLLAAYVNALGIGDDVITYPKLISTLNGLQGVNQIEMGVGTSPLPALGTGAVIPVGVQEIARVDNPYVDILVEYL